MLKWLKLREAQAGSSSAALERPGSPPDDNSTATSGDGDGDDTPCGTCSGSGIDDGEVCGTCHGSGSVMREAAPAATKTCPTCGGSGKIKGGLPCPSCKGSGKVPADWKPKPAGDSKPPWLKEAAGVRILARLEKLEADAVMFKSLREAKPAVLNATFSTPTRVKSSDGSEGYKVVLIREGMGNSEDANWYSGAAIQEMCESGVAEGMQAYANHPDMEEEANRPERDVKQLVGCYRDVTFAESGGVPRAEAVFVPLTTNESHPTYGWVVTLAEAASNSTGPQPLAGISLYGLSAGDYGKRPDGSEGRVVTLIRPTSGDIVTNAGAGGGFVRRILQESARRLRRSDPQRKDDVMRITDFRTQMAEALKQFREADSDEARTSATDQLKMLEAEAAKIDVPAAMPGSVEALTEAAPALVTQLKEAAKAEAKTTVEELQTQLRESQDKLGSAETLISGITSVQAIAEAVRSAGVTDGSELRHFVSQAQVRGLKEAADVKDMVETQREYDAAKEAAMLAKLRESFDLPEVEGVFSRTPDTGSNGGDGGASLLRESGIPIKTPASA